MSNSSQIATPGAPAVLPPGSPPAAVPPAAVPPAAAPAIVDALNKSIPYFFTMDRSIGSLKTGKTYLFRRDASTKRDIVSSIADYKSISASPLQTDPLVVDFWGVPLTIAGQDASGICLKQAGTSACAAHFLTSLFGTPATQPPGTRESVYMSYLENYLSDTVKAGAGFLIDGGPYNDFYQLGTTIKYISRALPFVTKPEIYNGLTSMIETAILSYQTTLVPALIANAADFTYATEVGALVEGLPAYYALSGDPSIPALVKQLSDPYLAHVYSHTYGLQQQSLSDFINTDTTLRSVPVLRAVFMEFAVPRQLVGVDTLDGSFMAIGMQKYFAFQTTGDQPVVCYDTHAPYSAAAPQPVVEGYGGFPHMAAGDTCVQDKDHTAGYISGLQSLAIFLQPICATAAPGDYWYNACANLPSSMLASLAWLDSLQVGDGTGRTWNMFPSTLRPFAEGDPDPYELDAQCFESTAYNFWSLYNQLAPIFSDSTQVKVDYNGRTKPLRDIASSAQKTVDCIVNNNGSWIWLPEYVRAKAVRAGVNVPQGAF